MKKAILLALTPFFLFMVLSFVALGPTLPVIVFHLDDYGWSFTVGTSMEPTIKPGAIIIYDRTPNSINVGDIIVYRFYVSDPYRVYFPIQFWYKYIYIGHRVIRVLNDGYLVLGDNNTMVDPWVVHRNQVVGKVVWIINNPVLRDIALLWLRTFDQTS